MSIQEILELKNSDESGFVILETGAGKVELYSDSIDEINGCLTAIGKLNRNKYFVCLSSSDNEVFKSFIGESQKFNDRFEIKLCHLIHKNVVSLQNVASYARPHLLGLCNSFGFGDRLGIANPGHIKSLNGFNFKPILAQQSIRELTRTNRKPEDVMDAAVWAVVETGFRGEWGADADHLKTTADIDLMMNAGFTFYTFDPSEYVVDEADSMSENELVEKLASVEWASLRCNFDDLKSVYTGKEINIGETLRLKITSLELLKAIVKYGNAVAHIKKLYDYLKSAYADKPSEVEISVDETESVTTPFEHYFIANELTRLGVQIVSLAPRFVGDFEKGIDYKGDIELFTAEYRKHLAITKHFGNYKISLHSGSDKFRAYEAIGRFDDAFTHIKTAGTSYLEALRVCASADAELFRKILDFSRGLFETEKRTYHVSAKSENTKPGAEYSDEELPELLNDENARQILHVTFGRVLTDTDESGNYLFKNDLMDCLRINEQMYYEYLERHFKNHLKPFRK